MAKVDPRIQLDPHIYELIEAVARTAGMTKREYVEHAVLNTVHSDEIVGQFREIAAASAGQLMDLAAKVDGISNFIADRYSMDWAEAQLDEKG